MTRVRSGMAWLALLALLFVAPVALAQDTGADTTPAIEVADETTAYADGVVTITRVYSEGPGWVVVHADDAGAPGEILGYTAVRDGENLNVTVDVDTEMLDAEADSVWLMLHSDLGTEGTFEFPGADVPVDVDGEMVLVSVMVSAAAQPTAEATAQATAQPTTEADTGAEPETLPTTGGSTTPWLPLVLLGLGLAVVAGSALIMRREAQSVTKD